MELYKKYRPRRWEDIIGQDDVVKSLRNAVKQNKYATTYTFSGIGGTGKTSTAWILAKALNCENLQEDGNPCNECDTCLAIDKKQGVVYVSMAEHGKAENVRRLMSDARLQSDLKVQVFILDEVQGSSKEAIDSMLIPFEDENMKSVFILSTTNIKALPLTLMSRSQLREFKPVSKDALCERLKYIAQEESFTIDDYALDKIYLNSQGSVRMAISLLEKYSLTGSLGKEYKNILELIPELDLFGIINIINEAQKDGEDMLSMMEQLYLDAEAILMLGNNQNIKGYYLNVDNPKELYAKLYKDSGVMFIMGELIDGCDKVKFVGSDARTQFSMRMMKIVHKFKKNKERRESQQ